MKLQYSKYKKETELGKILIKNADEIAKLQVQNLRIHHYTMYLQSKQLEKNLGICLEQWLESQFELSFPSMFSIFQCIIVSVSVLNQTVDIC